MSGKRPGSEVRKAMGGYSRDRLGLAMADGKPPVRLLE